MIIIIIDLCIWYQFQWSWSAFRITEVEQGNKYCMLDISQSSQSIQMKFIMPFVCIQLQFHFTDLIQYDLDFKSKP